MPSVLPASSNSVQPGRHTDEGDGDTEADVDTDADAVMITVTLAVEVTVAERDAVLEGEGGPAHRITASCFGVPGQASENVALVASIKQEEAPKHVEATTDTEFVLSQAPAANELQDNNCGVPKLANCTLTKASTPASNASTSPSFTMPTEQDGNCEHDADAVLVDDTVAVEDTVNVDDGERDGDAVNVDEAVSVAEDVNDTDAVNVRETVNVYDAGYKSICGQTSTNKQH